MPDPKRNFEAFKASLEESGFKVTPKTAPWSPDYLGKVDEGNAQVYLLGWTGDFGDPDNFVGTFFQSAAEGLGLRRTRRSSTLLDQAETETDLEASASRLYQEANRHDHGLPPGRPVRAHEAGARLRGEREGYEPSPDSLESFATVSIEE